MKRTVNKNDIVVLVHGLGGSRLDLWPLGRQLKRCGYQVRHWVYRSFRNRIEKHADRLANDLIALDADLGWDHRARYVRQPHHRESGARRDAGSSASGITCRSENGAVLRLADAQSYEDSYVNQLPNSLQSSGIEFGIVEAAKDRVIVQGGVLLDGYQDYASVEGHHGILAWYPQTIRLAENFLVRGGFS